MIHNKWWKNFLALVKLFSSSFKLFGILWAGGGGRFNKFFLQRERPQADQIFPSIATGIFVHHKRNGGTVDFRITSVNVSECNYVKNHLKISLKFEADDDLLTGPKVV